MKKLTLICMLLVAMVAGASAQDAPEAQPELVSLSVVRPSSQKVVITAVIETAEPPVMVSAELQTVGIYLIETPNCLLENKGDGVFVGVCDTATYTQAAAWSISAVRILGTTASTGRTLYEPELQAKGFQTRFAMFPEKSRKRVRLF